MIVNVVTPHAANGAGVLIESVTRCLDRKCTCNKKRTK